MGRSTRTLPRELLTDEESDRLLEQCGTSLAGLRNRALLLLLEGTGLRIAEALALEPRDLDWDSRRANVRHGKGNRQRLVPVAAKAIRAVDRWLKVRAQNGIKGDAPVCCNLQGGRLSTSYARKLLPRLAEAAGITKRVHPHAFRHRFTVRLIRSGVPLTSVSKALGHSSLATTHRYCARLGAGPAVEDVRAALIELDRGRGSARTANDRFAGAPGSAELGLPEGAMGRSDGVRTRRPGQKRDRVKCARGRR